jgi:serine/threonine protein phosphatase PrpC
MSVYHTHSGLSVSVATVSRIGSRERNEDACGYWVTEFGFCFVVSDGAGGHVGGAVASEIAVLAVLTDFSTAQGFSRETVANAIAVAEAQILQGREESRNLRDMTATIAMLLIDAEAHQAFFGHMGDTRIYKFSRGRATQLTRDHSLVQNLVDAGFVAQGELRQHPERSVLLAALGIDSDITPSISERALDVEEGDALLICSDGLWEGVVENDMEAALMKASSVEEWLLQLETNVVRHNNPSQDNYTAIAVWVGSPGEITVVPGDRT